MTLCDADFLDVLGDGEVHGVEVSATVWTSPVSLASACRAWLSPARPAGLWLMSLGAGVPTDPLVGVLPAPEGVLLELSVGVGVGVGVGLAVVVGDDDGLGLCGGVVSTGGVPVGDGFKVGRYEAGEQDCVLGEPLG
jgi:hypothetical protein